MKFIITLKNKVVKIFWFLFNFASNNLKLLLKVNFLFQFVVTAFFILNFLVSIFYSENKLLGFFFFFLIFIGFFLALSTRFYGIYLYEKTKVLFVRSPDNLIGVGRFYKRLIFTFSSLLLFYIFIIFLFIFLNYAPMSMDIFFNYLITKKFKNIVFFLISYLFALVAILYSFWTLRKHVVFNVEKLINKNEELFSTVVSIKSQLFLNLKFFSFLDTFFLKFWTFVESYFYFLFYFFFFTFIFYNYFTFLFYPFYPLSLVIYFAALIVILNIFYSILRYFILIISFIFIYPNIFFHMGSLLFNNPYESLVLAIKRFTGLNRKVVRRVVAIAMISWSIKASADSWSAQHPDDQHLLTPTEYTLRKDLNLLNNGHADKIIFNGTPSIRKVLGPYPGSKSLKLEAQKAYLEDNGLFDLVKKYDREGFPIKEPFDFLSAYPVAKHVTEVIGYNPAVYSEKFNVGSDSVHVVRKGHFLYITNNRKETQRFDISEFCSNCSNNPIHYSSNIHKSFKSTAFENQHSMSPYPSVDFESEKLLITDDEF